MACIIAMGVHYIIQALDPLMQYLIKGMQTFNTSLSKPVLNVYVNYYIIMFVHMYVYLLRCMYVIFVLNYVCI